MTPLRCALVAALAIVPMVAQAADDPLPSWNDGPAKQAILAFVDKTTREGSPDFVPPELRIATFDNDGTLWVEQPIYTQVAFALDRVMTMAPEHPEWKDEEPFKSILGGDLKAALASGKEGVEQLLAATHAGMTVEEFERIVAKWIATAEHPRFKRPYTECIYQPMIEAMQLLRAHGFKTYIVSGGGVEFMRPWTEPTYGIPPEQVVGSSIGLKFEVQDGKPTIVRLPEVNFIDDGPGKPVGIQRFIGRRPIVAFGNSDGDYEMLQWTTMVDPGAGPRLGMIVHHTDAEREYAYDRDSKVGRLVQALDEAPERGWVVIDMKNDWKTIFK